MSFLDELRNVLGPDGLISTSEEVRTYECDGLTNFRVMPLAVVLPTSTEQVQAVLRICHRERIPFVARGSGTGLSGGALPVTDGIVISLARMNRILEVDLPNQRVVVEPGVINLNVTAARVAGRIFLCARSVIAIGVQHRRQRGRELRRRALPEIRLHYDARAGAGSGAAGRNAGAFRLEDSGRSGLRSGRGVRRLRRHAGRRDQGDPAHREDARMRADTAGGVRHHQRSRRGGERYHRGGHAAGRDRDDGQPGHSSGRGGGPRQLSQLRRAVAGGTGRAGGRSRHVDRAGQRHLPRERRGRNSRGANRRGARGGLERAQGGVRGGGPHLAELHRAGRRDPAHCAAENSE